MSSLVPSSEATLAGLSPRCLCCPTPQLLLMHVALELARRYCPETSLTHLDRGDGVYELETARFEPPATREVARPPERVPAAEVLSDRPQRTGPKVHIELDRATFAGQPALGAAAIPQMFPVAGLPGQPPVIRRWSLDLATAAELPGGDQGPGRLAREAAEMAEHFPRWILTLSRGRERVACPACGGALVFDDGLRCAVCAATLPKRRRPAGATLAWFGVLPPIGIDGLERLVPTLAARPPEQHVVGRRPDGTRYLLVPLVARHPPGYPATPPRVAYLPGFFAVPGMPADAPSHATHLLGSGDMCLHAPGEWSTGSSCREVLQQRAYAHVVKLLNWANGRKDAFAVVTR